MTSQLFDSLDPTTLAGLRDSIARLGVLVPVAKDQHGNVLDGHHRIQVADELGVSYRVDTIQVADDEQAEEIRRTLNVDRRQLSGDDLRRHILVLAQLREPSGVGALSQREIAQRAGVDEKYVRKTLSTADRSAVDLPIDRRGQDGKVRPASRPPAVAPGKDDREAERARQLLAVIPEPIQPGRVVTVRELGHEIRAAERDQRTESVVERGSAEPARGDVRLGDYLELIGSLDDGSVGLLLTDPPYAVTENDWDVWETEDAYWSWMTEWLAAARPKMADAFSAFVFCDADASVRLHAALTETGWPVLRQAIWHRPNLAKKRAGSKTFLSAYEPFWHAGTRALNLPDDWGDERFDVQRVVVPQSNHVGDPSYHPTQKPLDLMRRLVSIGSLPGELVLDPFVGGGTTAVAAALTHRPFLVGDQSERYVNITRARLAEVAG